MTASFQSRVLGLVGIGVFAATALLALLGRSSLLSLQDEIREERLRLARVLAHEVGSAVAADLRLLAAATAAPHVLPEDGDDRPERDAVTRTLRQSTLLSTGFFALADGTPVAAEPSSAATTLGLPAIREVSRRAVASQRPVVSDVITIAGDQHLIVYLIPFRATGERPAGAAGGTVDLRDRRLAALVPTEALDRTLSAELRDGTGRVIAGHARDDAGDEPVSASVEGTPWTLSLRQSVTDQAGPVASFRLRSLWLAPSLAALAMVLGWGIATSVRRPLGGLTLAAERIASGDLDRPVEPPGSTGGGDEILRLTAALERMRVALRQSIEQIGAANLALEGRVADRTRELADVNARLEERERLRQQLLRKVISAQEEERKRIARELHDETSQTLAALAMGVEAALATVRSPASTERVRELRGLVDRMHAGLHRLIVDLRPSVLDDLGLAAAIRRFAEQHLGAAGVSVRCEISDLDVRLAPAVETAVFRAVQEAIVNIVRHARAESVLIQGAVENGLLTIEVEDDGCGFTPGTVAEHPASLRGVGLLGMRERIEILEGTFEVDSEPGGGTRVVMKVPVTERAA